MVLAEQEADAGPRDGAAGRERLCIATRTVKPVEEMIRFVIGPDDTVVPDLKRRLPGRGVWVTATRAALAGAVKRNAFARGFKRPVRSSADLSALTDSLLERAALGSLAMARKAALVETGFARVEAAVAGGHIAALIHAADAAPDGVRKLAAAAKRLADEAVSLPVVTAFSSAQLDLALGRSNVIHAALLPGPASEAFLARYRSLLRFRGCEAGARTDDGHVT
jgi:predicted RNA-binding protein YlxR (DUF448 family)